MKLLIAGTTVFYLALGSLVESVWATPLLPAPPAAPSYLLAPAQASAALAPAR